MYKGSTYIKDNLLNNENRVVSGEYVVIDSEEFYKIANYDNMPPFFMSIVSNSDHWMFISSNGGVTAGRKNPDNALFPYYTDDKIHDSSEITGSKTILRITFDKREYLWEPFSYRFYNAYKIERNIYKNIPGNKIIFEEVNHDLGISFSYSWLNSDRFGFVKKSKIVILNNNNLEIDVLDGIQNILPYGVYQQFQNEYSTLIDGYKKSELLPKLGIGIFSLSSIPSDKAEPSESLKATTVWSCGLSVDKYLLSSNQLNNFRNGYELENESDAKGIRGSYFINGKISLVGNSNHEWIIVADINQDSSNLAVLCKFLEETKSVTETVLANVHSGTESLIKIVAAADGLQVSNDKLVTSRHFANVLFNVMRGGIFDNSYLIDKNDFINFLNVANKKVYSKYLNELEKLNDQIFLIDLAHIIEDINDNELSKLANEYLPLTFSRRHGDPSRPWNRFSIEIKDKENNKVLNYQGNWRDIFQNWEALAESFPGYIESMITKFLNGSTADGYNPYRVTRNGFEWEIVEPDMPWSNIGYWGDHQIIYLLKLLEFSNKHDSAKLKSYFDRNIFTYLNVPYRIKSYQELLLDPHNTIVYDNELEKNIEKLEAEIGSDAKGIFNKNGELYQVNLFEKLLVPLLSKLSNFIPGGGIWMNTQRPEWNDANNALVGYGVSMVTLYYTRRYVCFLSEFLKSIDQKSINISSEVNNFFASINSVLFQNEKILESSISDKQRKQVLDGLGEAGSVFRESIYKNGFSFSKEALAIKDVLEFLSITQKYLENTIDLNRREDGLYHAYNLMSVDNDEIKITYLYEMLEGQVAVLSSGYLSIEETINLLTSLRNSSLYREDQNSYVLYPNRELTKFINKNIIPLEKFESSKLLTKLVQMNNSEIVLKDTYGNYHFNGDIRNSLILKAKLKKLSADLNMGLVEEDEKYLLELYESVFNHKSFTGRSGTFYKYEGLGSIYWHMVSKLALSVQEAFNSAKSNNAADTEIRELTAFYNEIKEGIGVHKSPSNYGAFPTDPYSHTPSFSGVQQPGMTGQVKEDVISRFGELGITVKNGQIHFNNDLLNEDEFLSENSTFMFYNVNGEKVKIELSKNSIGFTYCQVPVVYIKSNADKIIIHKGEEKLESESMNLSKEISRDIFWRRNVVSKIEVYFNYQY